MYWLRVLQTGGAGQPNCNYIQCSEKLEEEEKPIVVVEEDRQINMQDMGEAHITQEMIRIMKQGLALAMVWSLLLLIVLLFHGYRHQKIQE